MDEAPSRTLLLRHRAEREMVREGKAVLENRRDLLAHLLIEQTALCATLGARAEEARVHAGECLRRAVMRHGSSGLAGFAVPPHGPPAPGWRVTNRLGTAWVEHAADGPGESDPPGPDEGWDVSVELEAALAALSALLALLADLAPADNNLARLVVQYRRTQRRVNALEEIVLPQLDETIRAMQARLEELDRDDLVRSLLTKRRRGA